MDKLKNQSFRFTKNFIYFQTVFFSVYQIANMIIRILNFPEEERLKYISTTVLGWSVILILIIVFNILMAKSVSDKRKKVFPILLLLFSAAGTVVSVLFLLSQVQLFEYFPESYPDGYKFFTLYMEFICDILYISVFFGFSLLVIPKIIKPRRTLNNIVKYIWFIPAALMLIACLLQIVKSVYLTVNFINKMDVFNTVTNFIFYILKSVSFFLSAATLYFYGRYIWESDRLILESAGRARQPLRPAVNGKYI